MEQETLQMQSNKKQYMLVGGLVCAILALAFGTYYITNNNELLKQAIEQSIDQTNTQPTKTPTANIPSEVICYQFKNLEEALRRIDIACILDLNGSSQSINFSSLSRLTNLNEVNLSNNNLAEFPEALFGLKNLLIINLSNNNLSTIPEKIKKSELIKTLQILNLTGNPISASQKEVIKALLPNVEITF